MGRKVIIKAISSDPGKEKDHLLLNDEWVCIANAGSTTENLSGWILLCRKPDGRHYHHYHFPALVEGRKLELKPGQMAFVMTGSGQDKFIPAAEGESGQYHLYHNLDHFIWNEPGDKVCLFAHVYQGGKEFYELVDTREISL